MADPDKKLDGVPLVFPDNCEDLTEQELGTVTVIVGAEHLRKPIARKEEDDD